MTRKPINFTHRPGAAHDVFSRHQRKPMPSETMAAIHGDATMAAIRVAEARKALEVFQRIAARDRDAGRPASMLLAERLRAARAALVDAERNLAEAKAESKRKPAATVDDDD